MKTGQKFNPQEAVALGRALRTLRQSCGLSQHELSAACGVSAGNLCLYEQGRTLPRYDTLRRILAGMELPFSALHRAEKFIGDPSTTQPEARAARRAAVRLAQEAGKAVAHACLVFLELQAGGWQE